MKVVIAPDGFKGSISAAAAAGALATGWKRVRGEDEIFLRPMADGGEGTLDSFCAAVEGAERVPTTVIGPDGKTHQAAFVRLPTYDGWTAVVDLAIASGIEWLGPRRLPWTSHTFGFGQLIAVALDSAPDVVVAGIGSSASTDGGVGLLTACGARFFDSAGRAVARGARGLLDIRSADLAELRPLPAGGMRVLTDVDSPLTGPKGAAAVFGPQKGLPADSIEKVDRALERLADILDVDPALPGMGAAGGVGMALAAWGADLVPGAVEVGELIGLPDAIACADVVLTGEGRYDGQSAAGKVPSHVAGLAGAAGARVVLVAGSVAEGTATAPFAMVRSLTELAGSAESALADPARWLARVAEEAAEQFGR